MHSQWHTRLLLGAGPGTEHLLLIGMKRLGAAKLPDYSGSDVRSVDPGFDVCEKNAGQLPDVGFIELGGMGLGDVPARRGNDVDARALGDCRECLRVTPVLPIRSHIDDALPTGVLVAPELLYGDQGVGHHQVVSREVGAFSEYPVLASIHRCVDQFEEVGRRVLVRMFEEEARAVDRDVLVTHRDTELAGRDVSEDRAYPSHVVTSRRSIGLTCYQSVAFIDAACMKPAGRLAVWLG